MGKNTDPTLVVLQPLKPALQLQFFIMFSLFQFVAMSLKVVELKCSFYLTTVRRPLSQNKSSKQVRLEAVFKKKLAPAITCFHIKNHEFSKLST